MARRGIKAADIPSEALKETKIGFDFNFDITESNKASNGKLDFTNPFSGGKFSLSLTGSADKTRQAERSFRVVEDLEAISDTKNCDDSDQTRNVIYPITGEIGMEEVLLTFWRLNREESWNPEGEDVVPKVFSDTLTFSTDLNAGVSTSIEMGAGTGNLKLSSAGLDGSVERKDIHKVTVAISTTPREARTSTTKLSSFGSNRAAPYISNGGLPGKDAGASNVILELDRLRNRNEDRRILEDLKLVPAP